MALLVPFIVDRFQTKELVMIQWFIGNNYYSLLDPQKQVQAAGTAFADTFNSSWNFGNSCLHISLWVDLSNYYPVQKFPIIWQLPQVRLPDNWHRCTLNSRETFRNRNDLKLDLPLNELCFLNESILCTSVVWESFAGQPQAHLKRICGGLRNFWYYFA